MPLIQKKKELETVLENISDGVLFIDDKGTIRVCNRALMDMLSLREDITGIQIFSLLSDNPLRQAIFRVDKGFPGPYCWEWKKCPEDIDCPEKGFFCCRCWIASRYGSACIDKKLSCCECSQYKNAKRFLEKPKELEIGEKTISVLSSFIDSAEKNEIWEVIVFKNVTAEKLDAAVKLAGATAHEMRQPLQVIIASIALLHNRLPDDPKIQENFDLIKKSCAKMNRIITELSHVTRYRTRQYVGDKRILDIEESSRDNERSP